MLQLVILAAVQGITEFLPISSSGHLEIVKILAGWDYNSAIMHVAVHVGTLGAVMLYFWRDVGALCVGMTHMVRGRRTLAARLFLYTVLATIPVIVAGFALNEIGYEVLQDLEVIAWATIGFGILLWLVDRLCMTVRRIEHLTLGGVMLIGFFQVLALIPGTSRSGITMTAGRLLGMERTEAARFSLLLSMPTIAGAGLLAGLELYKTDSLDVTTDALIAAGLSFGFALLAIALMMAWLRRAGFGPFVVYRLILGVVLLYIVYGGTLPF